jgi:hypothetical protein
MQIHRLRRSLPCGVLLRDGHSGRNSSRRLHRLHGMRGGLPCARHLRGRRRSCGIHKRHRVQRRRGSQDQGFGCAGNHSSQRCSAYCERAKKSARLLRNCNASVQCSPECFRGSQNRAVGDASDIDGQSLGRKNGSKRVKRPTVIFRALLDSRFCRWSFRVAHAVQRRNLG